MDAQIKRALLMVLFSHTAMLGVLFIAYFKFPISPLYAGVTDSPYKWSRVPMSCWKDQLRSGDSPCQRVDRPSVLLIGDSHAQQLVFAMESGLKGEEVPVLLVSSELMDAGWAVGQKTAELGYVLEFLDVAPLGSLVVFSIAQHHLYYSARDKFWQRTPSSHAAMEALLSKIILRAQSRQLKVLLVDDTPRLAISLPISSCVKQVKRDGTSDCDIGITDAIRKRRGLSEILQRFSIKYGTSYVDPISLVCREGTCSPLMRDTVSFIDSNHLSEAVLVALGQKLFKKVTLSKYGF